MVYHFYNTSAILYYKDKIFNEMNNIFEGAGEYKNITKIIISDGVFRILEDLISENRNNPSIEQKYQNLYSSLIYHDYLYIYYQEIIGMPEHRYNDIIETFNITEEDELYFNTNSYYTYTQLHSIHNNIHFVGSFPIIKDKYTGYEELAVYNNQEIEQLYDDIEHNQNGVHFTMIKENEYLIIRDFRDLIISDHPEEDVYIAPILDIFKWCGGQFIRVIRNQRFNSDYFGELKPKDVYQAIAMDSLISNTVTLLGGLPGSGKTMLSLSYLFDQLQKNKIDRIILFCNPVGAKNAAKLGYYPGTAREKILSTQIGNILLSKIGDWSEVNRLMDDGTLQIIPVVDARGYEVPANSGVYIAEAQNLTSDLLRLILQRVGSDNIKVIIDGDREEQLDVDIYEQDNGMRKMSQVFRGEPCFGQVDLVNIYRSEVAKLAQKMR